MIAHTLKNKLHHPWVTNTLDILGHQTRVFWLFYPILGPLVDTSKENFENQTQDQCQIKKTFGGTAGQHLWTIVDP